MLHSPGRHVPIESEYTFSDRWLSQDRFKSVVQRVKHAFVSNRNIF